MLKLKHVSRETYEKLIFEVIPPVNRIHVVAFLDTSSGLYDIRFDTKNMNIHVEYSSLTECIILSFNGLRSIHLSTDDIEMEVT